MKRQLTKPKFTITIFLLLISMISNHLSAAQEKGKLEKEISIDGILNEPIWENSKKFTNFIQIEPRILDSSSVISEFYFTYDAQNIYIGGKLYQNKNSISASNARKDDVKISKGDFIKIGIDPLNNGNSAYFFLLNPYNAQADGLFDMVGEANFSWNAIFVSETKIFDDYWSFELKIPLTSISFQNKDIQTWGIMFSRMYAFAQETSINQLLDKNAPFRVSDFYKIQDMKGLEKAKNFVLTPYLYGFGDYSKVNHSFSYGAKVGGEIKYNPTPSTTILATLNPDYAQIESDEAIINVTDLPTTYQEKRPFFTESNDMYPGRAVDTRNITNINMGLKIRYVGKDLKADFTSVYDKQKSLWGFSNIRMTDNKKYLFEVITGFKNENAIDNKNFNYNFTMHGSLFFFNKQMQVYSWYGTINMPQGNANEFESVSAIKWISRNWNIGIWNAVKSELYNPNIVGIANITNQITTDSWLGHTFYSENIFFRKTKIESHLIRYTLFTEGGNEYFVNTNEVSNQFYLGKTFGNWDLTFIYKPNIKEKFRFRNAEQFNDDKIFIDAISPFVFVEQSSYSINFNLKTDPSKLVGAVLTFNNQLIRKSKALNYSIESFVNIGSTARISYSYNFVDIKGSDYQKKYRQFVHRIKAEYNINDKMNFRFILQPNQTELPSDEFTNQNFICNLTYSWEFIPGGNLYVVYNRYRDQDINALGSKNYTANNHSFILKVSKTF